MTDSSANRSPKKTALIITQPDKRKARTESSESDSAFRKMAAASRKQFYDLANPGKHLLKQFSSAGMAQEAYANLMQPWEAVNQNAVDALGMNPAVAYADSVLQEAISQSAAISTLNTTADALKALDAFNASLCVDSVSVEALTKKIRTIPSFKELSATVGFDSAEALAEKINPKAFDAAALGMATLPQPDYFVPELMKPYDDSVLGWKERLSLTSCNSYLPIANSKEDREAAENEELNRRFRESSQRMWEMQELQERRQKEIAKQAYLEALREHEAEKQAKEAQQQAEIVVNHVGLASSQTDFDKRLEVLQSWLIKQDYYVPGGVTTLPKGIRHKGIQIILNKEAKDSTLFDITLDTFKRHFWQKQQIAQLKRGR